MMSDRIRIIIVEDELIISDNLRRNLERNEKFTVVGQADNYFKAIYAINQTNPDIVLIDIKLKGEKTGIDVAKYINRNFQDIIFIYITSYIDADTIDQAKITCPAGYISKPFNFGTIFATIEVCMHNSINQRKKEIIEVADGKKIYRLNVAEIICITSDKVYLDVYLKNNKITIRHSLSSILKLLPTCSFWQINRSTIINRNYIDRITQNDITIQNKQFKISKSFKGSLN